MPPSEKEACKQQGDNSLTMEFAGASIMKINFALKPLHVIMLGTELVT